MKISIIVQVILSFRLTFETADIRQLAISKSPFCILVLLLLKMNFLCQTENGFFFLYSLNVHLKIMTIKSLQTTQQLLSFQYDCQIHFPVLCVIKKHPGNIVIIFSRQNTKYSRSYFRFYYFCILLLMTLASLRTFVIIRWCSVSRNMSKRLNFLC